MEPTGHSERDTFDVASDVVGGYNGVEILRTFQGLVVRRGFFPVSSPRTQSGQLMRDAP
ncbi:MAG TPA: hypothetical protein VEK56_04320 [Vicinamibacterales bacterium]|nr:hypothetical protein [Vicinamibacterales bacterium]